MQSDSIPTPALEAQRFPQRTDFAYGAMVAPISQSTTFARGSLRDENPFSYSRVSNPTVVQLECALAALESAEHAIAFGSGMSATTALFLAHARPGRKIICAEQVYGGSSRLIDEILLPLGIQILRVDGRKVEDFERAIDVTTDLVFVESPSNPTLSLSDLDALAAVCSKTDTKLAVDNTFLSPIGQDCKALGAGIRLQSTTKYIDGHNLTLGGVITTEDADLALRLRRIRKTLGLGQKPFEAWLTLQGLQTLRLRFLRQCQTAHALAQFLCDRKECSRVIHPSLPTHPQFELAKKQQRLAGAIITFELKGGYEAVETFLRRLRLIRLAENLGATQSLITHPASMTHADLPERRREELGITSTLLRLSVGLEESDALKADLAHAFRKDKTHG